MDNGLERPTTDRTERSSEVIRPAPDAASERANRRAAIESELARHSEVVDKPQDTAELKQNMEGQFRADIDGIEQGLGGVLSEESKRLIRKNVVDAPVAFQSDRTRSVQELRAERARLIAEDAVETLIPYDDPRMKEAYDQMASGETYVIGSTAEGMELVGVKHISRLDPDPKTVAEVLKTSSDFLAAVPKDEAVIMIEGVYNQADLTPEGIEKTLSHFSNLDEAVRSLGENGILLWQAREQGIEVQSPEKPQGEIVADLVAQGHAKDDIALYLTMRQLTTEIGRGTPPSSLADEMRNFAKMFYAFEKTSGAGWVSAKTAVKVDAAVAAKDLKMLSELAPIILEEFIDNANVAAARLPDMGGQKLIPSVDGLLQRNVGVDATDQVRMDTVNANSSGKPKGSQTNRISAAWNKERDAHIVHALATNRAQGKKSYLAYGASHVVAISEAAKELMKI